MSGHYQRGVRLEHAVRTALRADGFEVIRSAGSKSKVDLVAVKTGALVFVQCKLDGRCSPAERAELYRLAGLVGAVPVVAAKPPRTPISYRRLTGIGPRDHEPWIPDELADHAARTMRTAGQHNLPRPEDQR